MSVAQAGEQRTAKIQEGFLDDRCVPPAVPGPFLLPYLLPPRKLDSLPKDSSNATGNENPMKFPLG